jgi:hypothetical protein
MFGSVQGIQFARSASSIHMIYPDISSYTSNNPVTMICIIPQIGDASCFDKYPKETEQYGQSGQDMYVLMQFSCKPAGMLISSLIDIGTSSLTSSFTVLSMGMAML